MTAKPDNAPRGDTTEPNKDDKSFIQLDDDKKGAASAAPAPRSRAIAGVLAAACVVLIVVSLGFVHTGAGEAWSLTWITESLGFNSSSVASSKSTVSATDAGASDSNDSDESKKDVKKSEEKKDAKDDKDAKDEKKSSENKTDEPQESKSSDGATAATQSGNGSQAVAGGGSSSGGGSGNAGTSNGGQSSSSNGGSQDDGLITVTVSVTSSAVGNPVSAGGTYTFHEGATVYDALCALGLSVNAHGSQYGTYVAAIGGLAEKEHGGQSGWMYSVNGSTPMTACSNYVLSDGDNVVWYYVTG